MFSPDTVPSTLHTSRNPRRRQRSGDSGFQQNVKRQRRSKLSTDTFVPPARQLNGHANGHPNGSLRDAGVDISRLAIRHGSVGRGDQGPGKRAERGIELVSRSVPYDLDTVVDLSQTKNEFYVVNRLPNIPEQLEEAQKSGASRSSITSSTLIPD